MFSSSVMLGPNRLPRDRAQLAVAADEHAGMAARTKCGLVRALFPDIEKLFVFAGYGGSVLALYTLDIVGCGALPWE